MDSASLIWTALLFAGLVQGVFVSTVLLANRGEARRPGLLMAILTLVLTLMIGEELVDTAGLYARWPHALLSTFSLPLAIGPLLYLYALRINDPDRRWRAKDLSHFIPLILTTVVLVPFYRLAGSDKLEVLDRELGRTIDFLVAFKGTHVLAYQVVAFLVCGQKLGSAACAARVHFVWFRRMLAATFVPVVLIHILYFFPTLAPSVFSESDRFGSLVVAGVIYSFAFAAIKRPFFLISSIAPATESAEAGVPKPPKYRNSPLEGPEKQALLDALLGHMKRERPYRDPEIGLDDVAAALSVSPHALSQVINELVGVNFYAFMNDYRIEAVKRMMADPAHRHRKLLALAFDAGFNSKTSFNRVFRERTGMTPSQCREELELESPVVLPASASRF